MQPRAFLFYLLGGVALFLHPALLTAALPAQRAPDKALSSHQLLSPHFSFTNKIKLTAEEKTVSDYSNFAFQQNYLDRGTRLDVFLKYYFLKMAVPELRTQMFYFYKSAFSFYKLASNPWNYYFVPYGYRLNLSYSFSSYQLGLMLQHQLDY